MLWMLCHPTASLFLLLFPCFPAQDGGANELSADVISAWEGDSISITCTMNGSQNQVWMYFTLVRDGHNVIYVPKHGSANINPAFANRINYSKEGKTFRITLHKLQESDSKIYQCIQMVTVNDHHKELHGKMTIVAVKAKSSRALEQSPLYANPEQGQSVSITCVLKSSPEEKFFLLRTHVQPGVVLRVSYPNMSSVSPAFESRLVYSREGNRTMITLHNLQEKDSDTYVCAEEVINSPLLLASGTMVVVKDAEVEQAYKKSSWYLITLIVMVALLFCALVCCALYRVDVKKYFQKKKPNVVYEDMSYNSRRSTLVRTNTYSRGE